MESKSNNFNFSRRMLCEISSAYLAALTCAPIIKIVDASVTAGQSGKTPIFTAAYNFTRTLVLTPHKFIFSKYFAWIYFVYSSTYTTNNCIDSLCKLYQFNEVLPKLIGVTFVNMSTSVIKDAAFARYFGTKPPAKVPMISYCLWLVRDSMAIAAAFIIPERVSSHFQKTKGVPKSKADTLAQFSVPISMQVVLLPIHLLGLDIYNNNVSTGGERAKRVIKNYFPALPLRFIRMAGAFGFGGVNNKKFRNKIISHYEGKDWMQHRA